MQKTAASKPVYQTEAVVVRIERVANSEEFLIAVRFLSPSAKAYYREAVGAATKMQTKKISLGEMWKSEASGEVYIVTSFCKDVFATRMPACEESGPRPKASKRQNC